MVYSPEYYKRNKAKRLEHNRRYREANKDEINKRRRVRYAQNPRKILDRNNRLRKLNNINSLAGKIGYDISSISDGGHFIRLNFCDEDLGENQQIRIDFKEHLGQVLEFYGESYLARRYFVESIENSVYIYIDSAVRNSIRDELKKYLEIYKRVLEREVTHSKE